MATSARWQVFLAICALILLSVLLGYYVWAQSLVYVPAQGGTYTEGLAGSPIYLNPLLSGFNEIDSDLCSLIFDGLTTIDAQGQVVPNLARAWRVEDEGLSYVYELRQDVLWHDGAPFTVQDVLFTVQQMQDPAFAGPRALADFWRDIQVEALDMYTVRFRLPQPFAPFPSYAAIGLLPSHLLAGVAARDLLNHPFNVAPIGTGPFRVADVDIESIVLERNPDDFRPRSYLDQLVFKFYPTHQALLEAYGDGEIDGISRVLADGLDAVRADESLALHSAPTSGYTMVFLNLKVPVLAQAEVRQALLYGLDRQGLIDTVLAGQGVVAHSPIPDFSWAYNPEAPRYAHDPQRAASLLDQAGWIVDSRDGVRRQGDLRLKFNLTYLDREPYAALALEMAQQWAALGVLAVPQPVTAAEMVNDYLRPRHYDAALYEWTEMPPDPDLYALWHSTQATATGQNLGGWDDDASDILLEEGRLQRDGAVRKRIYDEFQVRFADQVPALPLFRPVYSYAISQRVHGVQLGPLWSGGDRFRGVQAWYVQTRRLAPREAQLLTEP